ncbi:hypothetical protein HPB50_013975 [Hyalomma asiaticum]|uniref:Uncharacterized protein n=1 Tax=Hyalomma asiaticum TaxID=266040 RepID=A0ACB7TIC7_HYAAI|nr:hypothetical protein HPB50_013975 [Hyalomma asiaticum]
MENLKVRELIEICEELGLTLGRAKRKQAILEIMKKEGVTAEEAPSVASATVPVSGHRIRDQLPPFVVGEDMAKYLVKFEHVCERNAIERSLWAQNLLALLPGEVSDVITCLSREAFESYDEVKEALLRRYKLSPEAFRQRFRYAKRGNESHVDFAFRLKADLVEWLKGEDVYDDRDKVVECIALEQFYRCIEDDVKLWLQDKLGEVQLNKAAELAEEYYTRRNLHSRAVRVEKAERKEGFPRKPDERKPFPNRNLRKDPIAYMALTRSQARKLSQELDLVPCSKTSPAKAAELRDLGFESTAPRTEDSRVGLLEQPVARAVSVVSVGGETEVAPLGETGTTLSPVAESWCELSKVDRETLIREQRCFIHN